MSIRHLARLALYSLVVITPFIVVQNFLFSYIGGKMLFIRGIAFVVTALTAYLLLTNKQEAGAIYEKLTLFYKSTIARLVTLGVLILGISTVVAFDRVVAFFGEPQRSEGFLTLFCLYALFVSFWIYFEKKHWHTLFILASLVSGIIFIITIGQLLGGNPRPDALQGNPTFLGGYFLFTLFAGLELWLNTKKYKTVGLLGFVIALTGIVLSGTRAAIFGIFFALGISLIIGVIYGNREAQYRWFRKLSIWALGILVVFSIFFGATRTTDIWKGIPGLSRIAETNVENVVNSSRALFYEVSLKQVWHEPVYRVALGWGWDNYVFFWQKNYIPQIFYYDESVADRSHNKFIDMLVMTGVVGFLAYLALWFVYVRNIVTYMREAGMRALPYIFFTAAYFVFLFFTFDLIVTLLGFYMILAYMEYERHA